MSRLLSCFSVVLATMALLLAAQPSQAGDDSGKFKHVLLISIDGMHAVDFINCSKGINGGAPYCPNLGKLAKKGVTYTDTSSSKPSDSFPGLTAIVSGGSPRIEGAFYDVAYDRSLDPPTITTGNGVAGTGPTGCTPGAAPTGTTTEFDEGIDIDQSKLNGGAPAGVDGGIQSIDPLKLERDPAHNCAPVYGWDFVRTNTVFAVIHAAGATRRGPTSIRRIPPFQVTAPAARPSTTTIRRRSIPCLWRCPESARKE